MSRAKLDDNSNAVTLFPFLAVLLCIMGALIVVLVCVTRLSRDQALAELAAQEAAAKLPTEPDPEAEQARRKLDEATAYLAKLREVRAKAQQQLHGDQSRLSHLEDHIRRLQEKLGSLRLAADELEAMEDEHFDDREQANRELARLEQLIRDSRETIEELRAESKSRQPAYAIVPYQGPNGTHRRPLYIECRRDEVVLQPEGIRLTEEDFLPPLGPGNPLASALRAAREQIQREEAAGGEPTSADPYPLILVRPDGIASYLYVRAAIESWDSDFGYEFVDGDWDLKFPPANPPLAAIEYQAVETARARMRMLAAAAPRAYGAYRSARGSFAFDDDSIDDSGGGFGGHAGDSDSIGATADGRFERGTDDELLVAAADDHDGGASSDSAGGGGVDGRTGATGGGQQAGGNSQLSDHTGSGGAAASQSDELVNSDGSASGGPAVDEPAAGQTAASGSRSTGAAPADADAGASHTAAAGSAGGPLAQQIGASTDQANAPNSVVMNSSNQPPNGRSSQANSASVRGKDWAIQDPDPGAVPIRRTIQIIVRRDRLAILPESDGSALPATGGREIPLTGSTDRAADELVAALKDHIDQWGIAGRGLYWRPVLELTVGPDGGKRADDLARLLNNSGLELQTASVTSQSDGEAASANR